ncbi:MAG: hypothetical protein A2167_05455 [Planctomycetes bacterium RBG_13_46_10]|nr:MAG: hypothetical protein A2167_05455 [Planctomycetes bacterium RBG_13_46_10]
MPKSFFEPMTLTIPAGSLRQVPFQANFVTLLENNLSTNPQVGIGQAYRGTLKKGISVELPEGEHFTYIQIYNPAASDMTIEIAFSIGRIIDNRLVLEGTIDVNDTAASLVSPVPITLNAGNSYSGSIPANVDRKSLLISVVTPGNDNVAFGDENVDVGTGRGLLRNGYENSGVLTPLELKTSGIVYMEAEGDAVVSYVELI